MCKKIALIFGSTGQDGAYLANFLLSKNYIVYGATRDATSKNMLNFNLLNIAHQINFINVSLNDFRSVIQVIKKTKPDEIYNLSGQSSVALSFEQPVETFESIVIATINILEAIKFLDLTCKFYNAGSSEVYGNSATPVDENTSFNPKSPYGIAKATSFWQVLNYRESYGIFATTGILFNHESPLRNERFVTKKIIDAVDKISKNELDRLILGNLKVSRDWGWAPEYVEAMWLMLQTDKADDYIIATGETISLEYFVKKTFELYDLDWHNFVEIDNNLLRPNDFKTGTACPLKAEKILNWKAKLKTDKLIEKLVDCKKRNKVI